MKTTLSSKLRHQISFLSDINDDELSDAKWVAMKTCNAEIKPMYDNKFGSIENFSFGLIVTEAFYMFKIRFSKSINTKMRIKFNERIFEIKRIINPGEENILLHIITLEI